MFAIFYKTVSNINTVVLKICAISLLLLITTLFAAYFLTAKTVIAKESNRPLEPKRLL